MFPVSNRNIDLHWTGKGKENMKNTYHFSSPICLQGSYNYVCTVLLIKHLSLLLTKHFHWQENIPIEEVLEKLKCTTAGLTSDEVQKRLEVFGHNKLEEKKVCCYFIDIYSVVQGNLHF